MIIEFVWGDGRVLKINSGADGCTTLRLTVISATELCT